MSGRVGEASAFPSSVSQKFDSRKHLIGFPAPAYPAEELNRLRNAG